MPEHEPTAIPVPATPPAPAEAHTLGKRLRIGRSEKNDVVLEHPGVGGVHAEILRTKNGPRLRDLSHGAGTRLNGAVSPGSLLVDGDEIGIGPYRFRFSGETLQPLHDEGTPLLSAYRVSVTTALGKVLLQPTSLLVRPGELIALVGPSGAGKSTLLRVMTGVQKPSAGHVNLGDDAVEARLSEIGYVPQSDTVHDLLTAREGLRFAAALRLPDDTPGSELDAAVDRVLSDVGLAEHADSRVGNLSGGQRKRVAIAVELISRPRLLMLDEPTAGLDPGLERRIMRLSRSLADDGRSVVVVTHATQSLALCDRVGILAPGGRLVYLGPPALAPTFFGVEEFDDIYGILEETPTRWPSLADPGIEVPPVPETGQVKDRRIIPQTITLTRRLAMLMARDRRNLLLIVAQVVGLGLATGMLFRSGVFDRASDGSGHPSEAAQLLFLAVTVTIWCGAMIASRQVVSERSVLERELATGLRIESYLLSKAVVLGIVTAVQTVGFWFIVFSLRPPDGGDGAGQILNVLILTAWVGAAMGLLISAWARSEDQATSLIPLALIPQLLFGGAIVPIHQMGGLMQFVSLGFFSRYSFAGTGSAIDMNGRIAADPALTRSDRFGDSFFAIGTVGAELVLLFFLAAFSAGVFWMLRGEPSPRELYERARVKLQGPVDAPE